MDNFDLKALYKLNYGLYVITSKDLKDNGCIVNTVMQVTSSPIVIAVCINKENYTCKQILKTNILNINCLSEKAPFEVFKHFGFQSGKDTNKFSENSYLRSSNGLIVLSDYINSFISLSVNDKVDLGSHIMFLCKPTEGKIFNDDNSLTYDYYQKHIKQVSKKKGYVCKICGYVYEGENLPSDFICPICKHGSSDFELI